MMRGFEMPINQMKKYPSFESFKEYSKEMFIIKMIANKIDRQAFISIDTSMSFNRNTSRIVVAYLPLHFNAGIYANFPYVQSDLQLASTSYIETFSFAKSFDEYFKFIFRSKIGTLLECKMNNPTFQQYISQEEILINADIYFDEQF